jgi:hypothetical protein
MVDVVPAAPTTSEDSHLLEKADQIAAETHK